jgi:hypothetical protein
MHACLHHFEELLPKLLTNGKLKQKQASFVHLAEFFLFDRASTLVRPLSALTTSRLGHLIHLGLWAIRLLVLARAHTAGAPS